MVFYWCSSVQNDGLVNVGKTSTVCSSNGSWVPRLRQSKVRLHCRSLTTTPHSYGESTMPWLLMQRVGGQGLRIEASRVRETNERLGHALAAWAHLFFCRKSGKTWMPLVRGYVLAIPLVTSITTLVLQLGRRRDRSVSLSLSAEYCTSIDVKEQNNIRRSKPPGRRLNKAWVIAAVLRLEAS